MRAAISTLLILTSLLGSLQAADFQSLDSVATAPSRWRPAVSAIALSAAGAAMTVEGLAATHNSAYAPEAVDPRNSVVADVAQFAPLAFPWVMKAAGVPTRSGWGRMVVSQALGFGIVNGLTYGLKHAVDEVRPDGSDDNSFPSGHTARAFMGATAAAIELSDASPWYAVGAYTFATGIAVQRVVSRRHFPIDVVAGAGIGILSAEIGYYLGDVIFGPERSKPSVFDEVCREANLSYIAVINELRWPLGQIDLAPGYQMQRMPALEAGIKGGMAFGDWGLSLFLGLQSMPLRIASPDAVTQVATSNAIGFYLAPYYQIALSRRFLFNAEIGAGYYRNLTLNSVDHAISVDPDRVAGRISAGIVMNLTRNLSVKANIGYEISSYGYSASPSAAYHIAQPLHASGTAHALVAGLSSRLTF